MIDLEKLYDSLNKLDCIDCWTIGDQDGIMRMDLTLKSICNLADMQSMLESLADLLGDKYLSGSLMGREIVVILSMDD